MIFKKMLDKCLFFSYKHGKIFYYYYYFFYKENNTAIQGTTFKRQVLCKKEKSQMTDIDLL